MSVEEKLRQSLKGAFKLRALMYYFIFGELREELGEEKAAALMKRAIAKGGEHVGKHFSKFAPADLDGLRQEFFGWVPDGAAMFQPEVCRCDKDELVIQFHACPLKEAFQEAGLSEAETEKMLDIAAAIDQGMFTGAGFDFSSETWKPGRSGCCRLRIRPGQAG